MCIHTYVCYIIHILNVTIIVLQSVDSLSCKQLLELSNISMNRITSRR